MERLALRAGALTAVGSLSLLYGCSATEKAGEIACDVKAMQAAAPADTTITEAERLDKPAAHCRVDGFVTTTNPGPNRNHFRLQLPDKKDWKGRFYFIGLGGSAGYVPTDSELPGGDPITGGFAVAGTDTGRQGSSGDWTFLSDPVKNLDHTHRGGHVVTVATQAMTRAYYGVEKMWRYQSGCSGGGRMAGMSVHFHPGDYDGLLYGESRLNTNKLASSTMMKYVQLAQEMNAPGAWVSPEKFAMLDAKVTAACDETDGARDDVVWDPRLCKFDVAAIQCKGADGPDCLTAPQVKAIKAVLDGPRGPDGQLIGQPLPISNITTWTTYTGKVPPPWSTDAKSDRRMAAYMIAGTRAKGFIRQDIDILTDFSLKRQADLDAWAKGAEGFELTPDLSRGEGNAKIIYWGGMSSPGVSAVEAENYVRRIDDRIGPERRSKFLALYHVPGMGHCGGGTGPGDAPDRLLMALVDWVENGKAPAGVVTHRGADRVKMAFRPAGEPKVKLPAPSGPSRDFLICPYPQVSVFDASKAGEKGAVLDAANWSCRASRS